MATRSSSNPHSSSHWVRVSSCGSRPGRPHLGGQGLWYLCYPYLLCKLLSDAKIPLKFPTLFSSPCRGLCSLLHYLPFCQVLFPSLFWALLALAKHSTAFLDWTLGMQFFAPLHKLNSRPWLRVYSNVWLKKDSLGFKRCIIGRREFRGEQEKIVSL